MLHIDSPQHSELATRKGLAFERRAVVHLRTHFPARFAALGQARTERIVVIARAAGQGHGLVAERDLLRFIDLCYALGPSFEHRPEHGWLLEILQSPGRRPSWKMDTIERRLIAQGGRDDAVGE